LTDPLQHGSNERPPLMPGGIAARARAARPAPYLDGLNPEQREAVETLAGPVLVLAGAGTGKTRVLTTRIAHILASGHARPSEILAVTFTNKAARQMKVRVGAMIGEVVEGMPWLGTFHSIGVRILRRHAELVGLKPDFTILDADDQIRLIRQVLSAEDIDEKRWPARVLGQVIDGWKNRGLVPDQVPAGESASFAGKGKKLYVAYQERLKVLNAADFGDLLIESIRLLREQPDVLRQYQARFKYILVDEYQDTNVAQYLWLRLLGQSTTSSRVALPAPTGPEGARSTARPADLVRTPKNICCVGDDDQSIYGWRGAEVDNILRFEHDFPGAKVIRLERNYRSTSHILAAASHLIAHNQGRLGKTLRTDQEPGEKIEVTGAWDSEEEARSIGDDIEALQCEGHSLEEIAILVRASFQMREFEDRFVTLGLNYRVIGGPRFYERAEIRDALAYLRLVNQPADDLAFERIVNVPKRGLGDATVRLLHDHARKRRIPLLEATRDLIETDILKPRPRSALRELVASFDNWRARKDKIPHTELARIVLDESGYTDMWRNDRSADAAGRLENLKELVRSMEEFENLQGFLEHISLVMDADGSAETNAVSIMTIHSAKGLEFDTVFLPGWEEGLFPHQRSLEDSGRAGLEEERRLAHVALTRARRRVRIYFAANRRLHGLWQATMPSRFLDELPEEHVEVKEAKGAFGGYGGYGTSRFDEATAFGSCYGTPGWQRAQRRAAGFDDASQDYLQDHDDHTAAASAPGGAASARGTARTSSAGGSRSSFRSPDRAGQSKGRPISPLTIEGELVAKSTGTVSEFAVGDRVFHQKFGYGNVVTVDGNKLTIQFDKAGQKRAVDIFVQRA
jgi:ATP-dependent DNA helicase UvrD/PcrA